MTTLFSCPCAGPDSSGRSGGIAAPAGHSFDVAREGYVDLLPANRRHSRAPGDDRAMVDSPQALSHPAAGTRRCGEALCRLTDAAEAERPVLLDAGCGEGLLHPLP
jgi:23S rRNA (guanine745-N1)-methyltransferase